ncbi:MAG TPA: hypothetical protein VFS49_10200 [Croceibacterium sp.]|nr:hypothetical protein [Croceibacterium sp.]
MAGDRIAQALARIDAAASRIEAAARKPAPAPGDDDAALARRYGALRDEAVATLAELDRLIGSLER